MAAESKGAHQVVRAIVDYGGFVTFVAAYFLRLRVAASPTALGWALAIGGHGQRDLTQATWWLVGGSAVALAIGLVFERRLAPMPLIAGGFALVFGGLTIAFHDPRFIKIKPTVVNIAYGLALLIGVWLRRNPLKWLLGEALALSEGAWRQLTIRYAVYFMAIGLLNEIVWRTQSTETWMLFHGPGLWILVLLFSLAQIPFMQKHLHTNEPPPPPAD